MATVDRDEGAVDTLLKRLEDAAPDMDTLDPSPDLPPAFKPPHVPAPELLVDEEIDETELIEGEMGGTASEVADEDVVADAARLGTQDLEIAAFAAGARDETAAAMEGARETSVFMASARETAAAMEGARETAAAAMEGACEAAAAWAADTTRAGVMCEGGEGGEAAGTEREAPGRVEVGGLSSSNNGMGVMSGWREETLQAVWCEGTRKDERGGGESSSNRGTGVDTPRRCFEGGSTSLEPCIVPLVIHPTLDLAINTHSPACTLDAHGAALALDAHRTAARLHLDPIRTNPLVLDARSAALVLDAHGTAAHLRLDPIHADPQFFGSLVVDGENDWALGVREHAIAARVRGDFAHPAPSRMSRMSGTRHLLLL
ncbi:hypothetical protein DFH08DRAFT_977810 [Mycena albidolilacea]|uniref:Uncharacterized protein n=1 Tax=Mycena albidolilacea TaxID=1033008 RepID=A0AAD7E942_9AGAR|nr:hypothetical protein DFH08DRAFT_977810 [Mycena albidolilacea]